VVLGAVIGQPEVPASRKQRDQPVNKTPPTIKGTAEVGLTLFATRGTWSGNSHARSTSLAPLRHKRRRLRRDPWRDGQELHADDQRHRSHAPRARDCANSSGSAAATSAATGVVPSSGCPEGSGASRFPGSRPRRDSASPRRRSSGRDAVDAQSTPASPDHHRVRCSPVQGASVFATAMPYNQFAVGQRHDRRRRHGRAH
jgi:hypothetical protein